MTLDALDANGKILSSGIGSGTIEPGSTTSTTVLLSGQIGTQVDSGFLADGGADDAQGVPDIATSEEGVVHKWTKLQSGSSSLLGTIWGSGPDDIYVGGTDGTVLRSTDDGSSWTALVTGTTNGIAGIWGAGTNAVFAVGAGGVILKSTDHGKNWVKKTGTTKDVTGIWGSGINDIFLSVGGGVLRSTDGGDSWSTVFSSGGTGISGRDSSDVYALQSNPGMIWRTYDHGATWSPSASPSMRLAKIWAAPMVKTVYVTSGDLYQSSDDGDHWTLQNPLKTVSGIWGTDSTNLYVVGANEIAHSIDGGGSWKTEDSGTTNLLSAIWGTGPNDMFIVGDHGVILHYQ